MRKISLSLVIVLMAVLLLSGLATAQDSPVPVDGVTITGCPKSPIVVGKYENLSSTVSPASATNKNVTWSSSNEAIAKVEATSATVARITGVAPGKANITVTTEDGKYTAVCEVTVVASEPTATPRTGGSTLLSYLLGAGLLTGGSILSARRFKR